MKPTISLLFPSLQGGGVYRVMTNLAEGLLQNGCQVDLVVGQAGDSNLDIAHANLRVVDLAAPSMIRAVPRLVRYLKSRNPAYLISAQMHVNLTAVIACRLAKTPTRLVVSEHNDVDSVYRNAASLKARIIPHLARLLYPEADRILAVSHGVAASLSKWLGIEPDTIRVINNPIISHRLFDAMAEKLDHPWFQADQPPVILAVGRLAKQKDYPTLIQAFATLSDQIPARLVILGEGDERRSIEGLIASHHLQGRVALPGFVPNPYAYMSRASLFVLSSAWEGYPTVLVEALACGCPVVATDCPSGPAEILSGGDLGILVPVGDAAALAQAMLSSLQNPPLPVPQEILLKNSIPEVTKQYLNLLEGLDDQ